MPFDRPAATVEESSNDFDLIGTLRNNVSTGTQSVEAIFNTVASASRVMSGADGTALAIETKGLIVCRARSGSIAPGIGTSMSRQSGISGECLRTATMLVCHDTLCDPRVDAEVCEQLGIRSVVAVPLLDGTRGVGILEAFAARPNAFDGDALNSLRDLAEIAQIAHLGQQPAPPAPTLPPVPAPQPARYVPRTFTAEELVPQNETKRNHVWLMAVIAVALFLTVAVAWWSWHTPDETGSNTQTAHAAAAVETTTPKPLALQVLPKPAPGVGGKHSSSRSDSQPDIVLQTAAELQPVDQPPDTAVLPPATTRSSRTATDPEPTVVEAPSVSLATPADPAQLARLTSVQPRLPSGGPVVSQGVVQPVLVHKVDATYPMQARTQRLSGEVKLMATIASDGTIRDLKVLNGSPILAAAARNAVQQWRYHPATLNGTPIDVQKEITFLFEQP